MPDGVILNPADWTTTVLTKSESGDYLTAGPFSPIQAPTLWGLCNAIESAADILQPLTPCAHRYAIMKTMVYAYFERFGMALMHIGEPYAFIGQQGLHEVQVEIAHDGTVNGARVATAHEWMGTAVAAGLI